ncbi:hypothetical protein [Pinibacter soli]|uniref:Quercetin 2,3-dioxygenase C-terminal cupin domain-containing protein n=1 Tax=Pinibacter soli TaxID=3044211 RepID=A0ABT6RBQ2_9BACT|nr:hypothetical protein [Pinibacter soli]MDI3319988.1 hypothetical protein [Pinibacter soli]
MKNFLYIGQQPHNSTILFDEQGKKVQKDIRLAAGDEALLPEENPVVIALVANGLLVESKQNSTPKNSK